MKRIILISFLLFILLDVKSQEESLFNYNYPLEWQYDCQSMQIINNNYYLCGRVARANESCIYWLMGYHISKINQNGVFDNIKYFDKCEQGTYTGGTNGSTFVDNDSLYITGFIFTDSLSISYVLSLDNNLDTIFAFNTYSDTLTRRQHGIKKHKEKIILCGSVDSTYNHINNPTPYSYTYSSTTTRNRNGRHNKLVKSLQV